MKKANQAKYALMLIICLMANAMVTESCRLPGMRMTLLDDSNMYNFGSAEKVPLSISWGDTEGALWYNRKVLVQPRLEIGLKVVINEFGCDDPLSWAMDGWTIILSKTNNYLNWGGGWLGYNNIYDSIVTEFDFFHNPELGDISSNSVSIHRCFKSNCSAVENASTVQRDISFQAYNRCAFMVYDISLIYENSNFRIMLGDKVVVEITENLGTRFDDWAFVGFTGYFSGRRRELQISGSYICEDDFTVNFLHQWLVGGVWMQQNTVPTISAGSTVQLFITMTDVSGYPIPHQRNTGVWSWSLTSTSTCGTHTAFAPHDNYKLGTTLSGCTQQGTYAVKLATDKGATPDISFHIVGKGFTKLSLVGYNGNVNASEASATLLDTLDNYLRFNWGSVNGEFSFDEIVASNKGLTFDISSMDEYGNLFLLGTDLAAITPQLDLSVMNQAGSVNYIVRVVSNGRYGIFTSVPIAGAYLISSSKFDKSRNRYKFYVYPGRPVADKSFCSISGYTSTPTLDSSNSIGLECKYSDQGSNSVWVNHSNRNYNVNYGCKLERVNGDGVKSVEVTNPRLAQNTFRCEYTTRLHGTYTFSSFITIDNVTTNVPVQLGTFYVNPLPKDVRKTKLYDFKTNSFSGLVSNSVTLNYSLTSNALTLLDFFDDDGVSYSKFGYPGLFNPVTGLVGRVFNTHDTSIQANLRFEFFTLLDKKYVGVFLDDRTFFKKSSHQYQLNISMGSTSITVLLNYPLGQTNNRVVCIHDLAPAKTIFASVDGVTSITARVSTDIKLGDIILQTVDGFLYNYNLADSKRLQVTLSPTPTNPNDTAYITENSVEGMYSLRLFAQTSGTYTVSVVFEGTTVVDKFAVRMLPLPILDGLAVTSLNEFDETASTDTDKHLKAIVTADNVPELYFTSTDKFNNAIDYTPDRANNFLALKTVLTINGKNVLITYDNTNIQFIYNESKKAYALVDNLKQVGKYVLSITTQTGKTINYIYTKHPGRVSVATSSVAITSNKNLKVGQSASASVILMDSYGNNLASIDSVGKTAVNTLVVKATAADSTTITYTYSEISQLAMRFSTEAILKQALFTISTLYTDPVTSELKAIPCSDCTFNVNYDKFQIENCKLSAVLSKTVEMSTNSILQVNNQFDKPLFNFLFFDSNNVQLQYVDQNSDLVAKFKGSDIELTLKLTWIGNNQVLWRFEKEVKLEDIIGGNYSLIIYYNGHTSLTYPLQFLGDGQDSDASNSDPSFDLTYFSTTDLRPVAGATTSFNIQFRTEKNLRVNKYGDLLLFNFSNSKLLPSDVFTVHVQFGAKKGEYIISVMSKKTSTSVDPIALTIAYNGTILKQKVNVIVKNADLSNIQVDSGNISDNTTKFLKDGKTIDNYSILLTASDKFGNNFDDLFDATIFSPERIVRLFNIQHSDSAQVVASVTTDITKKNFSLTLISRNVGTVQLSSSFMTDLWKIQFLPGPISTAYTYGMFLTDNTNFVAGSTAVFSVFPRDAHNNVIKSELLTTEDYSKIEISVAQPKGVASLHSPVKEKKTNNSVEFSLALPEAGDNLFSAKIDGAVVSCVSCKINVKLAPVVFPKSKLMLGAQELSTASVFDLDKGTSPTFILSFYDQYDNLYNYFPEGLVVAPTFKGNESNVQFCTDVSNNQLAIFVCKDNTNRKNWSYLISKDGYSLELKAGSDVLVYNINLVGGSSDADASNGPIDVNKTFFAETKITSVAGVYAYFMIELRTADGKRKNYWYDVPNDDIKVAFSVNLKDTYLTDVSMGEKPGQYIVRVSSTKTFTALNNNLITLTIEKIKCTTSSVQLIVNPNAPESGVLVDSQGNQIARGNLAKGNADLKYVLNVKLFDKYKNVANVEVSSLNYNINPPAGKEDKQITSTIVKNADNTFTLTIDTIYSGTYTFTAALLGDAYLFEVLPGAPSHLNSLAKAPAKATAGDNLKIYIIPFDKNNNYINPKSLAANEYTMAYKYKDRLTGEYIPYKPIDTVTIEQYNEEDIGCKGCSAFSYAVQVKFRYQTYFRVTLGPSNEIKCVNCVTEVSSGPMDFANSHSLRYDSVSGKFVELEDGSNEDNAKTDIIYRIYPRDAFLNKIDLIPQVSTYGIKLIDKDEKFYILKNQTPDTDKQEYVEFVKNDDFAVNGDLTYNTLTGGTYKAEITKGTEIITKNIILIGRPGDDFASNQDIEEQNTVINESKLDFLAGQTGYLLIELRTVNNLRKNNWNQDVVVGYQIRDAEGKVTTDQDKSFIPDVIPAGVLGVFYATVTSTLSVTSLKDKQLVLQIIVNGKTVTKLSPRVRVQPGAMNKAVILPDFITPGTPSVLLDGDADTIRTFKVAATDPYANPTTCDPLSLKLSAIGPDGSTVAITAGREVTTGLATYVIDNKVAGDYSIGSDSGLLSSYTFRNKHGKLFPDNVVVVNNDKVLVAGSNASIVITPKDKFKNNIPPAEVASRFKLEVTSPSGKKGVVTSTTSGDNIIFSTQLTEKGDNVWKIFIDDNEHKGQLVSTVTPDVASVANSQVQSENENGVLNEFANNAVIPRNNKNPLQVKVSLKDKFNNLIDTLPAEVSIKSVVMSGNNMTPISFSINKNAENTHFILSVPSASERAFTRLVSGTYAFSLTVERVGIPAFQFDYKIKLTSDVKDTGYGNGLYVVENTQISNTSVTLFAANVFTINMRLKTAHNLFYNDDIDVSKDVSHFISPADSSFTFTVYKRGIFPGDYNIDIYSNISQPDTNLKLTIRLRDPVTDTFKDLPVIIITIKPSVPPASEKTEIVNKPGSVITADTMITFAFKLKDKFGNLYTKNNEIANKNSLIVTNNNVPVTNTAIQLKSDGVTYEISFVPAYPPRDCEFNIFYKDSKQQVSILTEPIKSTIVSEPNYSNTQVVGNNLSELAAGGKLDLTVMFYDRNNICVNSIDDVPAFAYVNGPLEKDITARISYQYKFQLFVDEDPKSLAICKKSLKIVVPESLIYKSIGTYKVSLQVGPNNYEARVFNQKIVPDTLDITKFVSKFTMSGDFNPGSVKAGTEILFSIHGNDKFSNQVSTSFLSDISLKLTNKANKVAVSRKDNDKVYDYDLTFTENVGGVVNASLKIYTAENYIVSYLYKNEVLSTVDTIRGPFSLNIVPGVCSNQYPELNTAEMEKASTGNPTYFSIVCRDRFNNKITIGGETFKVFLTVNVEESKTSTQVSTKMTDNRNGSYKFDFVPPLAGTYVLIIDLRGDIYGQHQKVIKDQVCPEKAPFRCPNHIDKCVANEFECVDNGGKCKSDAPFFCKVGGVDKCVVSQTQCDCPLGWMRCDWPDVCVPKDRDYMCSFSLPLQCATQFPTSPVLCPDGICRAKLADQPAQRVCPTGFVLCPDLSCRDSYAKCAVYEDCPSADNIRCVDQSCVLDQKDCPSLITCQNQGHFVCPDGSCVTSDIFCKPLPKCVAPNSILCPDNSCVSDIKNCPKQVACGHTLSLCSDVICKATCSK